MNPFTKRTDQEIVDGLRRAERSRRPWGLVLMVLGVVLLGVHLWLGEVTRRKVLQISEALSEGPRIGSGLGEAAGLLSYAVGLRSGLFLAQGAYLGAILLGGGIRLRFGGRKDRMLIEHFDRAQGRGASGG